jgi:hypothetical protein
VRRGASGTVGAHLRLLPGALLGREPAQRLLLMLQTRRRLAVARAVARCSGRCPLELVRVRAQLGIAEGAARDEVRLYVVVDIEGVVVAVLDQRMRVGREELLLRRPAEAWLVPDAKEQEDTVKRARGEREAVGRPCCIEELLAICDGGMGSARRWLEAMKLDATLHVPQAHAPVVARSGEEAAVGRVRL